MTILVTGAAGFIGFHASRRLLARGERVIGVDCLTDYYDVRLKQARLAELSAFKDFSFHTLDIADADALRALTVKEAPNRILHLAAQAGVRYSLTAPFAYSRSNLSGHLSVLEAARALDDRLDHLVYASSSSVYGERGGRFSEDDPLGDPVSLYAATKRADELMSATYTHLYGLPQTGLRFFTVYGPFGRPDMAYWSFSEAMLTGGTIRLFSGGHNQRDFTFVGDVVPLVCRILDDTPPPRNALYNIGGSHPVSTLDLVAALEQAFGIKAETEAVPAQPGDVSFTCADTSKLVRDYGEAPQTELAEGIAEFAPWFRAYRER